MSAKTCLLCGKPLGRMRPGAGSEFCSREHRNQYRLRRSMDCLTEANKVATLARRRENLKPLSSATAGASIPEPHGRTEALSFLDESAARAALRREKLGWKVKVAMPPAGIAPLLAFRGAAMQPRRAFPFRLAASMGSRIAVGRPPRAQGGPARLTAMPALRPPRPKAHPGNPFRVTARAGFRPALPLLRRAKAAGSPQSIGGATQGRILHLTPAPGGEISWVCRVEIPRPASWAPPAPSPAAIRFVWPGAAGITLRPAAVAPAPRVAAPRPGVPPPPALPAVLAASAPGNFTARRASRLISLAPAAPARLGERRLVFEDLAFPGAPEAPARLNWIGAAPVRRRGSKRGGV